MDDVELDNERHKREEQERRAKRKVRRRGGEPKVSLFFAKREQHTHLVYIYFKIFKIRLLVNLSIISTSISSHYYYYYALYI